MDEKALVMFHVMMAMRRVNEVEMGLSEDESSICLGALHVVSNILDKANEEATMARYGLTPGDFAEAENPARDACKAFCDRVMELTEGKEV